VQGSLVDNVLSQESGTAFLVLREFFLFLRECFFLVCFGKLAAVSDNANKSIIYYDEFQHVNFIFSHKFISLF
jgi:hypothetical protein